MTDAVEWDAFIERSCCPGNECFAVFTYPELQGEEPCWGSVRAVEEIDPGGFVHACSGHVDAYHEKEFGPGYKSPFVLWDGEEP